MVRKSFNRNLVGENLDLIPFFRSHRHTEADKVIGVSIISVNIKVLFHYFQVIGKRYKFGGKRRFQASDVDLGWEDNLEVIISSQACLEGHVQMIDFGVAIKVVGDLGI